MAMSLGDDDLLPGERPIQSKAANAVISMSEYGLEQRGYHGAMGLVGMKGQEAIGGKLHLTSYRLLFKSHGMNRATGSVSIYLPTITKLEDRSRFMARKIGVRTEATDSEFVAWGVPGLIQSIQAAADAVGPAERHAMLAEIDRHPERSGGGLSTAGADEIDAIVANPARNLEAITAIVVEELRGRR